MSAWTYLVLAVGMAAAYCDLRWRKIPRWLTVPSFALGLGYHAWAGGLLSALAAGFLGLGLGVLLVQLGAVGGGDAKLLAALGAMLGLRQWFWSVEIGVLTAALVALAQVAQQGRLWFVVEDMKAIVQGWREHGLRPHPEHNLDTPGAITAPFGVAMGVGVLCALMRL